MPTGLADQTIPRGSAGRPGLAARANESVRPTQLRQVFVASPLGGEVRLEFKQGPWAILIHNLEYNIL